VPSQDIIEVGQMLGKKTALNEVIAYVDLSAYANGTLGTLDPKSILIATYALCGFSNFSSIGIQIGGISAIAPGQRKTLTELGIRALIGGTVACFLTAAIAGILL
jgi:CNT family concentrative nucleoside transporter